MTLSVRVKGSVSMPSYFRSFGLARDPFIDTADPYFYCELGALRKARERVVSAIAAGRGLTVVLGDPGTGKTSLSGAVEQVLLADDKVVLAKILDPTFATETEFLIAVGRVFGLALPPRSSASLKNALKNFFFETAVLEHRVLVLVIDEAQNLSDENLEALRMLSNYHVPQRKLLNIVLFGQSELEDRIASRGNLSDRVDSWVRLGRMDEAMAGTVLDHRLERAGLPPDTPVFAPDARALLVDAAEGIARRLTLLAHLSMEEAADRASTLVNAGHVRAAMAARGIDERRLVRVGRALPGEARPNIFSRLLARLSAR